MLFEYDREGEEEDEKKTFGRAVGNGIGRKYASIRICFGIR